MAKETELTPLQMRVLRAIGAGAGSLAGNKQIGIISCARGLERRGFLIALRTSTWALSKTGKQAIESQEQL